MVKYQWSEDGTIETCERKDVVLEVETECYHCGVKIPTGTSAVELTAADGERYIMHEHCLKDGLV